VVMEAVALDKRIATGGDENRSIAKILRLRG